ncbi:hypothetical protein MCOR25_006107 [Pyricularia grisea]|uniref:Uncharacterized protein n=1 Tax=Pyricularia grisea TaxID=148305 RepID=A0A6P8AZD4_PYRGI|nr:hypothetical protein PgNI_10270 [Pyricularia grisea]KAI6362784.1 hypothetical protein MCOR25_006107 [Pyricularia grisea]TLD07611.1 hypothetical protein PgNI_10270 [Pyricularia grisea]
MASAFSESALREQEPIITFWIDHMIDRLKALYTFLKLILLLIMSKAGMDSLMAPGQFAIEKTEQHIAQDADACKDFMRQVLRLDA